MALAVFGSWVFRVCAAIVFLAGAAFGAESSCAASSECPPTFAAEHWLLQKQKARAVGAATSDAVASACVGEAVSRRRREGQMASCRRRHSTQGLEDSDDPQDAWTCDEETNTMRCSSAEVLDDDGSTDPCRSADVRRRRQEGQMLSCRRRYSSPGLEDSDSPSDLWRCDEKSDTMKCTGPIPEPSSPVVKDGGVIGFPTSGEMRALGLWCSVEHPPDDWSLKHCPVPSGAARIQLLTYNLFWWNLFDKRGGADRSAGKLIAYTAGENGYDLMAFQECNDRFRVLEDAKKEGLQGDWEAIDGTKAMAVMYRKDRFELISLGIEDVGEDSAKQYYGRRAVQWLRLRHMDGKTVLFMNHHGPLPVSENGGCTGSSTAMNILRVIAQNAHKGDAIVLVGDFNAGLRSTRIEELSRRLHRVFSGVTMTGVDHVFTNCPQQAEGTNLGRGWGKYGSDHDALRVVLPF